MRNVLDLWTKHWHDFRGMTSYLVLLGLLLGAVNTLIWPQTETPKETFQDSDQMPERAAQPHYTLRDLGDNLTPLAINDKGQIAGSQYARVGTGSYIMHPFLWQDGQIIDLGTLVSGPYDDTRAVAINEKGQVVGFSDNGSSERDAFLWQDGVMTDLGSLDATSRRSGAYSINNKGQVVGFSDNGTGDRPFLWQDGAMIDLSVTLGDRSQVSSINDRGQLAGSFSFPFNNSLTDHAYLWNAAEAIDLGTLGGNISHARAINNRGQVVGISWTADGRQHAFLWEHGRLQDLVTLEGGFFNATAVNNKGEVVGYFQTPTFEEHGFLWRRGKMVDLNSLIPSELGWSHLEPFGINDRGQITGDGLRNGVLGGFLLTPSRRREDLNGQEIEQ
jgi:probable HAF family extracellular repeat protein